MKHSAIIIKMLRIVFYVALTLSSFAALASIGMFFVAVKDLPRVPEPLIRIIETPPTEIYPVEQGLTALYSSGCSY
jgi:hypothetical protein